MHRSKFIKTAALLAAASIVATGCSTTASTTTSSPERSSAAQADRHQQINAGVDEVLTRLHATVPGSRALTDKADGILVFPSVIAAGLGIGGQYGEGALRTHGTTLGYYRLASLSIGLQAGAQSKAIVFLFMTKDALNKFRESKGWMAGADASVAVLKAGANGNIEAQPGNSSVVAFVLTNAGLMANLTLEGTKITPIKE